MPELPEVEVTRRGLLSHLEGLTITQTSWSNKRLRAPMPRKLLKEHIEKKIIQTIDRRAKYLLFRLHDGAVLVIHLGMTGTLGLFDHREKLAKHDHLRLTFNNSMEMRFNDARRFGSVAVWPSSQSRALEHTFSANEGLEPFSPLFNSKKLHGLALKRSGPVKSFLMNSKIISGIGNIYANEILFTARIHPFTSTKLLVLNDWHRVVGATRETLNRAIEAGGTTISDFIGSSGQQGYFQLQLSVYGRQSEGCPVCTSSIQKKILAGRATYYCSTCQPITL